MKVGMLGSGDVGKALGRGFVSLGHDVKMGTREPGRQDVVQWIKDAGERASAGPGAEAAVFGDFCVLATAWSGTENAVRLAGPDNLRGKIVIDVTNPLEFADGRVRLAVGHTDSAGERIQRWIPDSRVVKAFNIVGNAHMVHPDFPGGPPDMFICGNDAAAKAEVTGFLRDFGWPVVDMGGIESSREIESLAMLWINFGFRANTWNHAFKLLRK
jgi:8-hydroxy-5-deazaflavin:NADPH oxidoreductase